MTDERGNLVWHPIWDVRRGRERVVRAGCASLEGRGPLGGVGDTKEEQEAARRMFDCLRTLPPRMFRPIFVGVSDTEPAGLLMHVEPAQPVIFVLRDPLSPTEAVLESVLRVPETEVAVLWRPEGDVFEAARIADRSLPARIRYILAGPDTYRGEDGPFRLARVRDACASREISPPIMFGAETEMDLFVGSGCDVRLAEGSVLGGPQRMGEAFPLDRAALAEEFEDQPPFDD